MENTRKMVIDYINYHINTMVESHLECWASRYEDYTIEDLVWDLQVNHDFSLEYEWVEEGLEIDLTQGEVDYLEEQFIKEAKEQFEPKEEEEEIED